MQASFSEQAARAGVATSDDGVAAASAHGTAPTPSGATSPVAGSPAVGDGATGAHDPLRGRRCQHHPMCPSADDPDRDAARVVTMHPDQGWSLLCNGVILFDDTGEILPTGRTVEPRRGPARPAAAWVPPAPRRAHGVPATV